MKFSIKENLLKKSLMENIIFVKDTLLMPCKFRKPILKNICERQLLNFKSFCRTLSDIYGGKFCLYTEQKIRLSLQNFWMQNLQGTKKYNLFCFFISTFVKYTRNRIKWGQYIPSDRLNAWTYSLLTRNYWSGKFPVSHAVYKIYTLSGEKNPGKSD